MIVDTSALAAIALREAEAASFYDLIMLAPAPKLSAVSFVELVEVFARKQMSPTLWRRRGRA